MPRAAHSGVALLAGLLASSAQGAPVVEIDFYRALQGSSIDHNPTQSDDLASLGGVIKYIHTEIIPESHEAQTRFERKFSVDAVMGRRFKVKNPALSETDFVDFGPFVTFDQGQSTNAAHDSLYQNSGDFVGVQDNRDPGLALTKQSPNFWYSVSGFCPNLPWSQMPMADGTTTTRCKDEKLCEAKGTPDDPADKCIKYADTGDVVKGGLCDGGADVNNTVPTMDPNGTHGCAYTYGKPQLVYLDKLVGIGDQKCNNGKPCTDWLDFRKNCDDPSLKKMFNAKGDIIDAKNVSVPHSPFCVEYDIHPACSADCSSEACKNAKTKEIGIPFWLGRCNPEANEHRAALLADAFGIEGALDRHQLVAKDVLEKSAPCNPPQPNPCKPATDGDGAKGGPYCSRSFAGVCFTCQIPGTKTTFSPDIDNFPICPYDVLANPDYEDVLKPSCKSTDPSDVCCLFTGKCDGSDDPSTATLDAAGLRLVEHRCWKENSTEPMLTFASRVALEKLKGVGVLNPKKASVQQFAYHQWGVGPSEETFAAFVAGLQEHLDPAPAPAPTPAPPPGPKPPSGGTPVALIVILVIVGVVALALLGAFLYRRSQAARQAPLLDQNRGLASA